MEGKRSWISSTDGAAEESIGRDVYESVSDDPSNRYVLQEKETYDGWNDLCHCVEWFVCDRTLDKVANETMIWI